MQVTRAVGGNDAAVADGTPDSPLSAPQPLRDATPGLLRRFKKAFFNDSPTASPVQDPGQSATGVVSGDVGEADPDGDPLTVRLTGNPTKGDVTVSTDGRFVYRPSESFALSGGTDAFTVTIAENNARSHLHGFPGLWSAVVRFMTGGARVPDDRSSITKVVGVSVSPIDVAPLAVNDGPFAILENSPRTFESHELLANDTDLNVGDLLKILSVGDATHGAVRVNDDGTVTYTPATNYSGEAQFSYTAADGSGLASNAATVSIIVTAVNVAPIASDDGPLEVPEGGSRTFAASELLNNDADADQDDVLHIASVGGAVHGTIVLNDDGTVTFTPTAGYHGTAEFGYTASDPSNSASNTAAVSIVVTPAVNLAPVFGDPPFAGDLDEETGVLTGHFIATDPEGQALTFALASTVDASFAHVEIDPAGQLTFTPTDLARYWASVDADAQTITFLVSASDGVHTTTLTVPAPVVPLLRDDDGVFDLADLDSLVQFGAVQVSESDTGLISAIIGKFTLKKVNNADDALDVLNQVSALLGAQGELTGTIREQTIGLGANSIDTESFYRLAQTIDGIPVIGSDIILSTMSDGTVTGVFSGFDPTVYTIDTTPESSVADPADVVSVAAQLVLGGFETPLSDDESAALLGSLTFTPSLVVYAGDSQAPPTLAWLVDVFTTPSIDDPDADPVDTGMPVIGYRYYIYANGVNAGTLLAQDTGTSAASSSITVYADGLPHGNVPQSYVITVQQQGSQIKMIDSTRGIKIYSGDPRNSAVVNATTSNWDPSSVSAMANMEHVYDYYADVLGWRFASHIQNSNGVQVGVVNHLATGAVWRNAPDFNFVFGDDSEAALDIVGHEYTHAVIRSIVSDSWHFDGAQGAALNEAYGDIIGNLIEGKSDAGEWLVGEDAAGNPYRDMKDPSRSGLTDPGPAHFDSFDRGPDEGHKNANIFDHAAYLMIEDPGKGRTASISRETWAKVFYSSMHRLPTNATFQNARNAIISAASIQGFTPDQMKAITDAFDAVGISETPRVKIILRWGASPSDLDSHLTGPASGSGPRFHVYYGAPNYFKDGTYTGNSQGDGGRLSANLDYDDTSSYGPETTTIRNLVPGDYYFSVHDYSDRNSSGSTALSHSGATVTVLKPGQNAVGTTFRVDGASAGTTWTVFKLTIRNDGSMLITPIDSYRSDVTYV